MSNKVTDILVATNNPDDLDRIVMQFSAALVGGGTPEGYRKIDGCYVVRCFGDPGFIVYMINSQGYGIARSDYTIGEMLA